MRHRRRQLRRQRLSLGMSLDQLMAWYRATRRWGDTFGEWNSRSYK